MIYYYEEMYDEALRCLKGQKEAQSIETTAMAIQTYASTHAHAHLILAVAVPIPYSQ